MIQIIKKVCIAILILLCSCKKNKTEQKTTQNNSTSKIDTLKSNDASNYKFYPIINWLENIPKDSIAEMYWKEIISQDSLVKIFKTDFIKSPPLRDKTITFLWIDGKHGSVINEDYCKTISEPERAALGYIAMYALSDSNLGKTKEECTIESALNLDYSCSTKCKSYLKLWFRNDLSSLKEIENCHSQSNMASSQTYFGEITLTVKGNKIYINSTINAFSRDIWDCSHTEKVTFLVNSDNIKLIDRKSSEYEYVYYYPNDSGHLPPDGYKNNGHGEYRLPKKTKK